MVFGGFLGALKIWKSLAHGDKEILGQSQDYSKDFLAIKSMQKHLRNIANPNVSGVNYSLYYLELSSS